MIDLDQFRSLVIHTLQAMGPKLCSPEAVSLVLRTCVYESDLYYLRQLGDGPARGFPQVEMNTARDILGRYLAREDKADLRQAVHGLIGFDPVALSKDTYRLDLQLQSNIILGIVCCRLKYWMIPAALPPSDNATAQGKYYKAHYNTAGGKGTVQSFVKKIEGFNA